MKSREEILDTLDDWAHRTILYAEVIANKKYATRPLAEVCEIEAIRAEQVRDQLAVEVRQILPEDAPLEQVSREIVSRVFDWCERRRRQNRAV